MAIRERLRRTFSSKHKTASSSGDSTPTSSSNPNHYTGRTDIEYYKPHEIPRSKYRGRVDKAHQDRLDAYSFTDAFTALRRKSSQALSGIYSPGGTKSQSRRASMMSRNTTGSVSSAAGRSGTGSDIDSRSLRRKSVPAGPLEENPEDDTDVANAGLSRTGTATADLRPRSRMNADVDIPTVRLDRTATVAQDDPTLSNGHASTPDQPFTPDELEKAMTRATLKGNDDGTLRRGSVAA